MNKLSATTLVANSKPIRVSPRTFPAFLTNRQLFAARICIATVVDADNGTGAGAPVADIELATGILTCANDDDDEAEDATDDEESFLLARLAAG